MTDKDKPAAETPITDTAEFTVEQNSFQAGIKVVYSSFARALERELAALRAENERVIMERDSALLSRQYALDCAKIEEDAKGTCRSKRNNSHSHPRPEGEAMTDLRELLRKAQNKMYSARLGQDWLEISNLEEEIEAALFQQEQGWKLVPSEPTEDEISAMEMSALEILYPDERNFASSPTFRNALKAARRAMLRAASPAAGEGKT